MIEVEQMIIRVPNMSNEDATWIGEQVAGKLRDRLPENYDNQRLGDLNVKLVVPPGLGKTEMADRIAMQLLHQLNWI